MGAKLTRFRKSSYSFKNNKKTKNQNEDESSPNNYTTVSSVTSGSTLGNQKLNDVSQ